MKKKTPDDSGATLAGPSFVCSRKCSRSRAAYMCGGGILAGNTSACSRESSRSSPLGMGYMPLVVRKIPKRGYLMSLRQAVVGASPSRNLQNQSCVARLAPWRPESENGGVCGWCTTTQWAVPGGVVYATGWEKDTQTGFYH